jgi:ubiquinone biosynthesis protein UbiJ
MAAHLQALKPLMLHLFEQALNRLLQLDPAIEHLLAPMAGKVIALHITSLNQTLYFCPGTEQLQLLDSYPHPADATISGSLMALGLMGLSATPMRRLFSGEVRIEGDSQLAQHFQRLLKKLDLQLEHHLAQLTGERVAQQLSGHWRSSRQWQHDTLEAFRLNLQEFLQEETRDLPAKAEAAVLFDAIDASRDDLERLTARLDRLSTPQTPTDSQGL